MKFALSAIAAVLTVEAGALACSCIDSNDPAQLEEFAITATNNAVALVEAEAVTSFDQKRGGEEMVVTRVLAGKAPSKFRVESGPFASRASCADLHAVGQRKFILIYPAKLGGDLPSHPTSNLCTALLLEKPVFRDAVARVISAKGGAGDRGR